MHTKTPIKFAVVQYGYWLFGAGETRAAAIADCEIERYTTEEIEKELLAKDNHCVPGAFVVLDSNHKEFNYYLADHGCFEKIGDEWFKD